MLFELFNDQDIEKNSVLEITSHKNDLFSDESLYDPRLGSIQGQACATCNQLENCPGQAPSSQIYFSFHDQKYGS